ncbi:hypothetical protein MHEC_40540 [Mycobacterium heckeshornense]|uniref:Uncharacterized protein n=1 Tax=Mycobacterium heckeshornense TaxID=110505 RepID=A0A7R7GXG4_9MYCO|nr:hypothetical protein MHEC_40540 [Mycobacterium heckeshornense]
MASHVVDHNRNYRPAKFLHPCESGFVSDHLKPTHMPFNAFVFRRDPRLRPRKVHSPYLAVSTPNLVLQFGKWQLVIDHHKACFAFHCRLRPRIGIGKQPAYGDDATSSALLVHSALKFALGRPTRAQGCVEGCQCARTWQLACDFNSGPCRRRRETACNVPQFCTSPLVNHQPGGWPHPHRRIQNVYRSRVFHVEPVQPCGGSHTRDDMSAHEKIQRS